MTIKTSTDVSHVSKKPYPKLMISNTGCIVLFEKPKCSVCIAQGKSVNVPGEYDTCWADRCFTDYNEPVTIRNQ